MSNFTITGSITIGGTYNGVTIDNNAWTAYTPTITAGSGTITTKSATGRYKQLGKTIFLQMAITITTNGSGAVSVNATLPFTGGSTCVISGRENIATGKMLQGIIVGGSIFILNYDNTYPGADGANLFLSGVYESA